MSIEELRKMILKMWSLSETKDYHIKIRKAALGAEVALRRLEIEFMEHTIPYPKEDTYLVPE